MISPGREKQNYETDYPNSYRGFLSVLVYGFLILFLSVLAPQSAEAQTIRYVDTDCATSPGFNGDGTASTCAASAGAAGAYTSWANAESDLTSDFAGIGTAVEVRCAGTAADTTAVDMNGITTSAANYLKFTCDPGKGDGCNTTGVYSTAHYRLATSSIVASLLIQDEHVRIKNLQIVQTGGGDSNRHTGVTIDNVTGSTVDIQLDGNIITCTDTCLSSPPTTTDHFGIRMAGSARKVTFANNIIYGFSDIELQTQTGGSDQVMNVYNNTLYGAGNRNFYIYADGSNDTLNFKNNLMNGGAGDYQRDLTVTNLTTSNNVTEDTSSPDASYRSKACTFVDETGRDFNLDSGDTNCKDAGADLSADGAFAFSTDQAGDTRSGSWDIGALEYSAGGPTPTPTATYTPTPTPTATPTPSPSTTWGLAWPDGIEPGDPSVCEAPVGKTCYWVDCDAGTDGTGTYASPFWGFETVIGYYSGGSYVQGSAVGGDIVYIKGTCDVGTSVGNATGPYQLIRIARQGQLGTTAEPLIFKSWRGTTRATFDGEFDSTIATLGDAENEATFLANIKPITVSSGRAIRFQNLLFTRAVSTGIRCSYEDGTVQVCDIYSVEFKDNTVENSGLTGPLVLGRNGSDYTQAHLVRSSRFVDNYRNCFADGGGIGAGDTDCNARDNDGAIAIYSANGSTSSGTVEIYNSYFSNNTKHIRDKHNGQGTTTVYNNWFGSSEGEAIYDRQVAWVVRNNIFDLGAKVAMVVTDDPKPGSVDRSVQFYNNSLYDTSQVISTQAGVGSYTDYVTWQIYNNALQSTSSTGRMFVIGEYATNTFTAAKMTMDHNYFNVASASQTNFSCLAPTSSGSACTQRNFTDTMTYLSDASSSVTDPLFVNAASDNFCLGVGASSRTAGRSSGYIGAIDPADCVVSGGGPTSLSSSRPKFLNIFKLLKQLK